MPQRLIRVGGDVVEIVCESPAGSQFRLNRSGLIRRRIELLEQQLAAERAALALVEAQADDSDGRGTN